MNEQLMDYLYGEMSAAERIAFEAQLAANPSLKKELEELQSTRRILTKVDAVRPPNQVVTFKSKPVFYHPLLKWVAVAASFIAFVCITQPRIQFQKTGVMLTFGNVPAHSDAPEPDYPLMIQSTVAASNAEIFELLDSIQEQLGQQLDYKQKSLMATLEDELDGYQQKQHQSMVRAVNNQYQRSIPRIVSNFQNMTIEQRQEVKMMMKQLWVELQQQRKKDLEYLDQTLRSLQEEQIQQHQTINELVKLVNQ